MTQCLSLVRVRLRIMIAIVQHSAYRRSSHQHKGAARHTIDMVWRYRWPIPVGRKGVISTCIREAQTGGGGGSAPCGVEPKDVRTDDQDKTCNLGPTQLD
jgi:hypothetical protein